MLSPWAKHGFVDHTQYEFGSMLKLAETIFHVPSLTARDAQANDMLNSFDFGQRPQPPLVEPANFLAGTAVGPASNGYSQTKSASSSAPTTSASPPLGPLAIGVAAVVILVGVLLVAVIYRRMAPKQAPASTLVESVALVH